MKILLVEDEPNVASFIKEGLEEHHFEVDVAADGMIGRNLALNNFYDLIILDIILPYVNGLELCKEIREKKNEIPVLILTALGSIEDKLEGFHLGADDYVVKPFEFKELLARINVITNRATKQSQKSSSLHIADLILNTDGKTVFRNNIKIELTAKEFALLEYFMINKGKVLNRSEIAENVWNINFDTGTNIIDVYVAYLRKKIDKNFSVKLIHTVFGMGFMLTEF
jgi:two-component system, OmpR family, copper resistance phosphate regulon response regulator CusR